MDRDDRCIVVGFDRRPAGRAALAKAAEIAGMLGAPRAGLAAAMERLLGDAVAVQLLRHGHRPVLLVPELSR
ncbi:hypothetical protein [Tomitella cavernea]|uniref:Universal stress protein n=1 Tax=Tomitella cavernea TaxID=1387982 RepID=A0ABP9C7F7_9ACTN|nr:hypothetical protein [Tomitella cavernea]